jgi:putative ABC transport system ATP-binding protein
MADRNYNSIQATKRILALLRGDWRDVSVILIYATGVGLSSLVVPVAVKSLVNTVAFGTLLQPVVILTLIVGGVLFFSGIMRCFQLFVVEVIQRRLVTRLGLTLASRIPHIQREKFLSTVGPEYVLRFLEVFQVQKTLSVLLLDGIALFFQITIGLTLVSFYHPLFLAFALVLLIITVFIFSLLGWGAVQSSVKESDAKYDVATWLQDLASSATVFKSPAGELYAKKRANSLIEKYLRCRSTHFRIILRQVSASLLLQAVASSLLLGLGGWLVIKGQLTLGQLVAAELVFSIVLVSVARMGKHLESFYDLAAGVNKLDALLELPFEELTGSTIEHRQQPAQLRFEDLTIAPPGSIAPSLSKASLDIKPGSKIAIWGENGSGKSYITNIIFRLSDPTTGRVRLDEYNVTTIHPLELRNDVALIRDIEIFHGTIRDNITLGRSDIQEKEVNNALQLVGLADEVLSLPQGLETILRGTPAPLSRGMALRLMVARGILAKPRLLLLDGTLDLIDERSRKLMLSSILSDAFESTTVVFTHDETLMKLFPVTYKITDATFKLVSGDRVAS